MQPFVETVPMFAAFGVWEWAGILVIVVILLAGPRMPRLRGGFRRGMREFDKGASDAGRNIGGIYGKLAAEALTPNNQAAERYDPRKWRGARRYEKPKEWWLRRLWRLMRRLAFKLFRPEAT
jgi:Sec-independent protein translocase protein TatA